MPMQLTDIAIFLISAAACTYCIVLSRRLGKLQDMKDGLGATILAFSNAVDDMSATTNETYAKSSELAARLAKLMSEAQEACVSVASANEEISRQRSLTDAHLRAASQELHDTMRGVMDESRQAIEEMNLLTRETLAMTRGTAAALLEAVDRSKQPQRHVHKQGGSRYDA